MLSMSLNWEWDSKQKMKRRMPWNVSVWIRFFSYFEFVLKKWSAFGVALGGSKYDNVLNGTPKRLLIILNDDQSIEWKFLTLFQITHTFIRGLEEWKNVFHRQQSESFIPEFLEQSTFWVNDEKISQTTAEYSHLARHIVNTIVDFHIKIKRFNNVKWLYFLRLC